MKKIILHRAAWIAPNSQPVLTDGAVAVQNDRILDVGSFQDLKKKYRDAQITEHDGCALLPPLINAHTHLELSHISLADDNEPITGFTNWIGKLLAAREQLGVVGDAVEAVARETMKQQYDQGVIGIGDIGNTDIGDTLAAEFPGTLLHFNEVLGRSPKSRKSILAKTAQANNSKRFTAHAPYSTHAELIQSLKSRASKLGHPFPIHTAEPPSEKDLLAKGRGELFDFLVERGFIDKSYQPPAGMNNQGSVQYLHSLGVLDEKTICVHCVHVSEDEIRILADSKTRVCLCPGSNRYLHVGQAPVRKFLDYGLLPALGTDSRASNPEISIWREMRLLNRDHQNVRPEEILAMATLGGAVALGMEHDYGTLEKGKKARFLAVTVPGNVHNEKTLVEYLTTDNSTIKPDWVHEK